MAMRAGKLRHRVTIQEDQGTTQDSLGQEIEDWQDVATVWAAVEPLQGREFLEAKQLQAEVTTRIRIRYRSGIEPEMRVVWGSHTYDVVSVVELESRRQEIELMCREVL
jgi:SPP1 family predicted phage head-tail adaptor